MPVSSIPARLITAQGAAPSYAARAWVNFNGTGTVAIRASGNVSSITDHGTGDYSANFATPMPDANYLIVGAARQSGVASNFNQSDDISVRTVNAARFGTWYQSGATTAAGDAAWTDVSFFR